MHDFAPGRPVFLQTPYPGFVTGRWNGDLRPSVNRFGALFTPIRSCFSFERTLFHLTTNPKSLYTPNDAKPGPKKRGPVRGRTGAACYGRSFSAPDFFTLSGGRCGPVSRSRTRRGERLDAETQSPAHAPGRAADGGAAAGGPGRHPRQRHSPGPVHAPEHRRRHPGQLGPADGGAQEGGRLRGPSRSSAARPASCSTPSATQTPASGSPAPTGSRAARRSSPRAGSTPSSTRPWTSSPTSTRNRPSCWCWPCPRTGGGDHHVFHALIPVHQPKGLWDKVLGALNPGPLGQGRRPLGD